MRRLFSQLFFIVTACLAQSRAQDVLIAADEFHAMQVLSSQVFIQNTAGCLLQVEKGDVFYFMMDHRVEDFQNEAYRRMLDNAVEYHK